MVSDLGETIGMVGYSCAWKGTKKKPLSSVHLILRICGLCISLLLTGISVKKSLEKNSKHLHNIGK